MHPQAYTESARSAATDLAELLPMIHAYPLALNLTERQNRAGR